MKRFSLSRSERITKTTDFKRIFKTAQFCNGKALKLGVSRNDLGVSRIGVSLRKHVFKLAVSRNRLRRCVKEIFRLNKEKLVKGCDLIVIPRAAATALEYEELNSEFLTLAKKAGVTKD